MLKTFKTIALATTLLLVAGAGFAGLDREDDHVILVDPGMVEFTVEGESFLVVTTQHLSIEFDGVRSDRVWGDLTPLDGPSFELIKFLWTSNGPDPITLHEGILAGRTWEFDSDNVTGHNEKFE